MATPITPTTPKPAREKKPAHRAGKSIADFPPPEEDDEGDDEEEENEWIEYTDDQGKKLYFNPGTRSVRLNDPKLSQEDFDEQGNKWAAEVDEHPYGDDDLPANLAPSALRLGFDRARRNSAIAGEAWEKGEDKDAVMDDPELAAVAAANNEDDDQRPEMSVESIVDTLGSMVANLNRIVEIGQNVPVEAMDELRELKDKIGHIHEQMEEGKQMTDDRNDVDALIDFNHLKWDWDNAWVDHYRSYSKLQPYDSWKFSDWHMPEFLSDTPLPPGVNQIQPLVSLPAAGDASVTASTKLPMSAQDKVGKLIAEAYKKWRNAPVKEADCLVKVVGLNDYLQPQNLFFDHQHVRTCARDPGIALQLSLVPRPAPLPEQEPYISELRNTYKAKVKPDVRPLTEEDHVKRDSEVSWFQLQHIPVSRVELPFRVKLCGLDNLDENTLPRLGESAITQIYLQCFLFHGTDIIEQPVETEPDVVQTSPRWMQWVSFGSGADTVFVSSLPREVKLGFMLWGREKSEKEKTLVRLAYLVHQVIDYKGCLSTGSHSLRMWALPATVKGKHGKKREDPDMIFRVPNRENLGTKNTVVLRIDFETYMLPVVAPLQEPDREPNKAKVGDVVSVSNLSKNELKQLDRVKRLDPLEPLSKEDHDFIWRFRHSLTNQPHLLPKFLQGVKWSAPDFRFEAHRIMQQWEPPKLTINIMELLDVKYADYAVRKHAVKHLKTMRDDELQLYLLQLTQCLKFEAYHESPLSRFLIERAIRNPYQIGHHFFWHLKAEMHNNPEFCERYGLILEEYLSHCGRFAGELRKQNNAVLKMQRVAALIVRLKREEGYADDAAMKEYNKELRKLNRSFFEPMGKFQIPLDPKWEASTLIVEKCRYMSSKMVPLWLVFKNADPEAPPIYIMFKSGDDLRQDILTLQMIRVMDKLWLAAELDLRLKPYKCIATGVNEHGEGVGMIEIVLNSDTTSGIQLKYGGGAMGALKMDPIDAFLRDHNKGQKALQDAVDNFIKSCAGYCVATFVLGIGDRHNGNIMVTKDGHLFHIDFGHFLGNFKKKFGVNRERAAFVFTPEMAFVMGGRRYKKHAHFKLFLELCSSAFKILRMNANILETLFILMVSAGMPELVLEKDIYYLRDKLHLDVSEKKADKKLHAEINKSLDSTYRRFDNMIHNFKHG